MTWAQPPRFLLEHVTPWLGSAELAGSRAASTEWGRTVTATSRRDCARQTKDASECFAAGSGKKGLQPAAATYLPRHAACAQYCDAPQNCERGLHAYVEMLKHVASLEIRMEFTEPFPKFASLNVPIARAMVQLGSRSEEQRLRLESYGLSVWFALHDAGADSESVLDTPHAAACTAPSLSPHASFCCLLRAIGDGEAVVETVLEQPLAPISLGEIAEQTWVKAFEPILGRRRFDAFDADEDKEGVEQVQALANHLVDYSTRLLDSSGSDLEAPGAAPFQLVRDERYGGPRPPRGISDHYGRLIWSVFGGLFTYMDMRRTLLWPRTVRDPWTDLSATAARADWMSQAPRARRDTILRSYYSSSYTQPWLLAWQDRIFAGLPRVSWQHPDLRVGLNARHLCDLYAYALHAAHSIQGTVLADAKQSIVPATLLFWIAALSEEEAPASVASDAGKSGGSSRATTRSDAIVGRWGEAYKWSPETTAAVGKNVAARLAAAVGAGSLPATGASCAALERLREQLRIRPPL